MSFLSTQYGWAANSVVDFEVVLANGTIVNANAKENTGENRTKLARTKIKLTLFRSICVSQRRREQFRCGHGIQDADTPAKPQSLGWQLCLYF